MKKAFQMIGIITLTFFSFFITEKTVLVVNDLDDIMIQIKSNKDKYKGNYIDAYIEGNTIIPGMNGKVVNVNKSYKNMKLNGYYSDRLFVYDYTTPNISLYDNLDKYIIKGNSNKRMVSLVFIVKGDEDITDILSIINNYNIKVTFFIDYIWYENNNDLVKTIIDKGHTISIYMDNYTDSDFEWLDMVVKKINKQSTNFCYILDDREDELDICSSKGDYTIRPVIISDKTPLVDIKNKIESGSILSLTINSELKRELPTIIIYIKSKGYKLANLEEHILE